MMTSVEANTVVVRRFVEELWNEGRLDVAEEIIHPQPRNPRGSAMWSEGPASVARWVAETRQTYPGLRRVIHDIVAEGDRVVLYSSFTSESGIGGMQDYAGAACFVVEDGKIVEEPWSVWPPR